MAPVLHLETLKAFVVTTVERDQDQAIDGGTGRDLAIGKRRWSTDLCQPRPFDGVPSGGVPDCAALIIGQDRDRAAAAPTLSFTPKP
jgi:hypothetical protein